MKLIALPAFDDNYIWLLHHENASLVVDPGDASVVEAALVREGLTLQAILITHHHGDHTGGVAKLVAATGARVYGPAAEVLPSGAEPIVRLREGDTLTELGLVFRVLDVPGHTAGHIAYVCDQARVEFVDPAAFEAEGARPPGVNPGAQPLLFCGDTLFSAGCGRLFEGSPAQMLHSLGKLAALPPQTVVCATHEYTLSNLRFAQAAEPGNATRDGYAARCRALRDAQQPTLPSRIATELAVNPFLRSHAPTLTQTVAQRGGDASSALAVFTHLRLWKNTFQ